jgi:hypothetical protein
MKINRLLFGSISLLTALFAHANPVLITGTPADAYLSPPSSAVPNLGGLKFNFDNIATSMTCDETAVGCPTFSPSTYASQGLTITSPDGLLVYPFSTQSGPNELFDDSAAGSANINIQYAPGATAIGVGIADSDPVTIYLQALNSSGVGFGTLFAITIPETGPNPGNGYYVIEDTTPDVYGIKITQSLSSSNYSGLAIDDVQVAPEPSSFLLLTAGAAALGLFRLRKRA